MKYALFSVPVGTIYDLPQPIKEGETGPVSTIGDEGLYGQACQVRTAPGGVTAAGVHLAPDVAEVVSFYGYHGYVFTRELQFIEEAPLRDYLAEPMVLAGRRKRPRRPRPTRAGPRCGWWMAALAMSGMWRWNRCGMR